MEKTTVNDATVPLLGEDWLEPLGFHERMLHFRRGREPASLDWQPVHLRGGILVDVRMDELGTRRSIAFAAVSRRCRTDSASFGSARGMASTL